MNLVYVAVAAFGGGVFSALMGWLDSKEPFNPRIFGKSVMFAVLAGIGFAVAYNFTDGVTGKDISLAFLSGAGWDSITNRTLGAFK